ncbi:MAG: DUF6057 family protein [Muribaculum sp.]|nr:DUF6057 family protein [Muribaculum sp.]
MKNAAMLRWYDEMSFFAPDMYRALMSHPGGLIDFLGQFLTQLLFYPWLGTAALLVLWVAVAYILSRVFNLKGRMLPLAFLPSFCLLFSVLSFNETWISLRSYGSVFTPGLGMLGASLIMWGYVAMPIRNVVVKTVYLICGSMLYPVMGFYALLAVSVCSVVDVASVILGKNLCLALIPSVTGLVAVVAMPVIYYYTWGGTIADKDDLYIMGLPGFKLDAFDRDMWMPFAVMAVLLGLYAVVHTAGLFRSVCRIVSILLFAGFTVYAFCFADLSSRQLRSTVAMLRYIDHNQWEHVGYVLEHSRCEPDLYMMLYNNMARQRLGKEMIPGALSEPEPNANPRFMKEMIGSVFLSVPANYYLGKANDSYRWAMENMVSRRESIFYYKYMVRSALCNGEYELARKYNERIRGTLFHSYWADHYAKYIDDPALLEHSAEFNYIPEYSPKSIFLMQRNALIQ